MPSDYLPGGTQTNSGGGTGGTSNKGGSDYTTAGGANNGVDISKSGDPQAAVARLAPGLNFWSFLGLSQLQVKSGIERMGIIALGSFIGLVGVAVILAGSSQGKSAIRTAGGAAKGAAAGLIAGPEGAAAGAVAGAAGSAIGGGE